MVTYLCHLGCSVHYIHKSIYFTVSNLLQRVHSRHHCGQQQPFLRLQTAVGMVMHYVS